MSGMRSIEMMGRGQDTMMGGPGISSMRGDDRYSDGVSTVLLTP